MLSNTGLFATQPLRYEEDDSNDFMSYAPFPELSSPTGDHFLDSFISSKSFDNFDDWESQNTLLSLDTTSFKTPKLGPIEDLQSPFESSLLGWPSSPLSSRASDSPVTASSNHSFKSFGDDLYIDSIVESNEPSIDPSSHERRTPTSSLESKVSALSPDEIADLWTRAFPSDAPPDCQLHEQETSSPEKTESPPCPSRRQKRKSATSLNDIPTSKKRGIDEKGPRRSYQRKSSSTNSSSSCKGSKLNHNLIEKRYRCSLNDKIGLLREVLPRNCDTNCSSDDEDDSFVKRDNFGAEAEGKQTTKGAILSNAVRYIHSLEVKVSKLEQRLASDRASQ